MKRRDFLIAAGTSTAACLSPASAFGRAERPRTDGCGMLIDTTRCIGCRSCEAACAKANGSGDTPIDDPIGDDGRRRTSPARFSVVTRSETDRGTAFAKRQCMHCLQPACAAACLTRAMFQTERGPVIWREDKCMGCRYCMVSCPFDAPKFEFDKTKPRIRKCAMCWSRIEAGGKPACAEACPTGAIAFGERRELLREARRRIAEEPDRYTDHIYGEHEVGGTSVLYLAAVPFDQLGFRLDLGSKAVPEFTKEFLYAVPFVLTLLPVLLLGMHRGTREPPAEPQETTHDHRR
jgi:Fe-S-cluster-containing dehydrogenase component